MRRDAYGFGVKNEVYVYVSETLYDVREELCVERRLSEVQLQKEQNRLVLQLRGFRVLSSVMSHRTK